MKCTTSGSTHWAMRTSLLVPVSGGEPSPDGLFFPPHHTRTLATRGSDARCSQGVVEGRGSPRRRGGITARPEASAAQEGGHHSTHLHRRQGPATAMPLAGREHPNQPTVVNQGFPHGHAKVVETDNWNGRVDQPEGPRRRLGYKQSPRHSPELPPSVRLHPRHTRSPETKEAEPH